MPQIDISKYKKNTAQRPQKSTSTIDVMDFLNKDIAFGKPQLLDRQKEEFYVELSMLLLSGVDLKTSFELVLIDQKNKKEGKVFESVRDLVLKGDTFSQAIQKQKDRFSDYEYFSIQIGEETGKLGDVLQELAQFYKAKISQRRKVITTLTYPAIVLCTSFGAVFFMLKFVVPIFADVFTRFGGGELPWITSFILDVSELLDRTFWWGVLLTAAIFIGLYSQRKKLWWQKWSSTILLKIPIAGDIVKKIHLARFANTMRLLISTNTPLLRSIRLVAQMSDFYPVQSSLLEIEELILRGESLHDSLQKYPFYPAKIVQLVKVGEEVNRLDFFFEKIANQLTEEVEYKTSTLSNVLEPLLIIFLGLVVGLILIAMYLPMFQMSNSF